MTDKQFFHIIKHESCEYNDVLSEGFPYWMMKIFFLNLNDEDIDQAVEGLNTNDDSIDGFFINRDSREINIIQFKTVESEKQVSSCKKEWLSYLYDVKNKLLNREYIEKHKNRRIKDIAYEFKMALKKDYNITYYLFHLGYLNDRSILESYNKDGDKFFYLGFDDIKDKYEDYISISDMTEPAVIYIDLGEHSAEKLLIQQKISKYRTLVSLMTGDQLIRIREEHKYKIFEKNVRFNLGVNKINRKIYDTAISEKGLFYFYNNGITITCSAYKYRKENNSLNITQPQVINGAQTVESIFRAFEEEVNRRKKRDEIEYDKARELTLKEYRKLNVLFRLIQSDEKDDNFSRSVIVNNNSQNAIKLRDFYSNNPEQIELQKQLSKHGIFYEIKRGERLYIKKNSHIHLKMKLSDFERKDEKVDIELIASLYRAYLGEPSFRQKWAYEILDDEDVYGKLFGKNNYDITEEKVQEILFAYNIYHQLDRESKIYNRVLKYNPIDNKNNFNAEKFQKFKANILSSSIFNEIFKKKLEDESVFKENSEVLMEKIKKYYPFSQGKFQILGIYKLIVDKCQYYSQIIRQDLVNNVSFIVENLIKNWLPICLDKILVPVYDKTMKEDSISINAFYMRESTFDEIKKLFKSLDIEENKDFKEIFPLKF